MGALEELAASLVGKEAQTAIAAQNPYYKYRAVPSGVSDVVAKTYAANPSQYRTSDIVAALALSGLAKGTLGAFGDDYQGTLTDRYVQALGTGQQGQLPENLFRMAQADRGARILKAQQAAEEKTSKLVDDLYKKSIEYQTSEEYAAGVPDPYAAAIGELTGVKKRVKPEKEIATNDPRNWVIDDPEPIAKKVPMGGGEEPTHPGLKKKYLDRKEKEDKNKYDIEKQARTEVDKAAGAYNDLQANFQTMKGTYKYDNRPASLTFIQSFARVLDPGSVVRGEEIERAERSQAFIEQMGYRWTSVLKGTQNISPKDKLKMLQAAGVKYNSSGENILTIADRQKELVGSYGANPENVFANINYDPFDYEDFVLSDDAKQITFEQQIGDIYAPLLQPIKEKIERGEPLTDIDKDIINRANKAIHG